MVPGSTSDGRTVFTTRYSAAQADAPLHGPTRRHRTEALLFAQNYEKCLMILLKMELKTTVLVHVADVNLKAT